MHKTTTLPLTMHAVEIRDGALHPTSLPVPVPVPGELLIRVAYAGVNRADILQLEGRYAPPEGASPLPGLEVSGWVAACGQDVQGFEVGQEVCALLSGGGYGEYVAVPAALVLPLPAGIDLKHAATLPEAAATSIMALVDVGRLVAGERVLIHGGTSGLGILMTQSARALGAEVFTTVGSAEKAAFMESFGIHPLNHRERPFDAQLREATAGEGVDLIIDTLGAPKLEAHWRCLRQGGRLVTLAMMEGSVIPEGVKMTRLLMNHLSWSGATLRSRSDAEKAVILQRVRELLWPELENGRIHPVIDRVFALENAKKACQHMQERLHMGKILLEVAPE